MSKKHKFDLTNLVHDDLVKEGEKLCFVSNPSMFGIVTKMPNHEYKVKYQGETITVHAFAQKCLGQEPPDHASKWFKGDSGKTLYELWQMDLDIRDAA